MMTLLNLDCFFANSRVSITPGKVCFSAQSLDIANGTKKCL